MLDPHIVEMIRKNAELVIESTRQQFGVALAYDQPSVEWLNEHIEQLRDQNLSAEDIDKLINVLGSFYGECIRRHFEGEWGEYQGHLVVLLKGEHALSPFGTVMKQFESGAASGESVSGFFATIPGLLADFHNEEDSQ